MATDRNRLPGGARHQIHPRHIASLRDAACVHAHELGEWIAALRGRAILRGGLAAAHHRDVRDRTIPTDYRGHGQHAQRNGLEKHPAVGVENGERVVGGERQHSDPMTGSVRALRHCRGSGYVVAQGGRRPAHDRAVAAARPRRDGIAVVGEQLGDRLGMRELLRPRDAAAREVRGHPAHRAEEGAPIYRIDRDALHTRPAVERSAGTYDVVLPGQAVRRAMHGDPDLPRLRAEAHAKHPIGKHALYAGRRHALRRGDRAGIGDFAPRLWGGSRRRLQQDYKRKCEL